MWIIDAPSSTARFASAAYSSGVYGIAGHCSRLATAPEIEQVTMQGGPSSPQLLDVAAGRRILDQLLEPALTRLLHASRS